MRNKEKKLKNSDFFFHILGNQDPESFVLVLRGHEANLFFGFDVRHFYGITRFEA
jgi:hypothetical protein